MQETPYQREPGYPERYRDLRFQTGHGPRTDRRERQAVAALLAQANCRAGPWLDVPCGTGRLSHLLPGPVVRVDRDPGMLRACTAGSLCCASAAALPFADATFAGSLCMRLLQHVPEAGERTRILAELRRVTDGPVLVSFFDSHSVLHLRRVLRRATGKTRSGRHAISRSTFTRDLHGAGLRPLAWHGLRRFIAEQTLVLAVRDQ